MRPCEEEEVLSGRGVPAGRDAVLDTLPFALDTQSSVSITRVSVSRTLFSVAITLGSVRGAPISTESGLGHSIIENPPDCRMDGYHESQKCSRETLPTVIYH